MGLSIINGLPSEDPLLEQPLEEVTGELHAKAVSQFVLAKAAVPVLRDSSDSSYIIISGSAGAAFHFL